jgi:hypothetical protein
MATPDVTDAADYGMPAGGFKDGEGIAVEDPTTDQSAAGANVMLNDVAQMTHTALRAWARFTAGAAPAIAGTNGHDAMWGSASGVKPVPAKTATGTWTLTWPATVQDQLGNTHNVNLRKARVSVEGSALKFAQCVVTAPNVVTVYGFIFSAGAFAADDLTGITLLVEAG